MSNKRIGRRGPRPELTGTSASSADSIDDSGRSDPNKLGNKAIDYEGPLRGDGIRFPEFHLGWGKIATIIAAIVGAAITATVIFMTFKGDLEDSLDKITEDVASSSADIRSIRDATTRNEVRVNQLQTSLDEIRGQIAEHRRSAEGGAAAQPKAATR